MNKYPLIELAEIKKKRLQEAEKLLKSAREERDTQEKKCEALRLEYEKIESHKVDKITQLREILDTGTTTDKIDAMKLYLKSVEVKLLEKNKAYSAQKKVLETAEKKYQDAKEYVFTCHKAVEKFSIHKSDWMKELRKIEAVEAAKTLDELGSIIYTAKGRNR